MSTEPLQFARLSNLRHTDDGSRIAFQIECKDGESADISCSLEEIGNIITFLAKAAHLVGLATEESGLASASIEGESLQGVELPARGAAFSIGRTPEEAALVVNLTGFYLAFSFPTSELARVSESLSRTARTLSAPIERRN